MVRELSWERYREMILGIAEQSMEEARDGSDGSEENALELLPGIVERNVGRFRPQWEPRAHWVIQNRLYEPENFDIYLDLTDDIDTVVEYLAFSCIVNDVDHVIDEKFL